MQLTAEQEQALFWFSSPERAATIDKIAIDQLIAMDILCRDQDGEIRLTSRGRAVCVDLLRSREF